MEATHKQIKREEKGVEKEEKDGASKDEEKGKNVMFEEEVEEIVEVEEESEDKVDEREEEERNDSVKRKDNEHNSADKVDIKAPQEKKKWEIERENSELRKKLGESDDEEKNEQQKIPFLQRLKKRSDDAEFAKFVDMIRKIDINIPLVDAITKIPSYGKFLKDIMTKKMNIVDVAIL